MWERIMRESRPGMDHLDLLQYRNYGVYPEEKNTIHSPMVQPRSLGSKPGW